MLTLAAYTAGVPVLPLSTAYSLPEPRPRARPRHRGAVPPGHGVRRRRRARSPRALDACGRADAAGRARRAGAGVAFADLVATAPATPIERAFARAGPRHRRQAAASPPGSTGAPKGVHEHAPHAVLEPAGARPGMAVPARRSRPCSWTGFPGATRSAATTTSARSSPSAARSTSTTAGPSRGCSTARVARCASSRRPSTTTCRPVTRCSSRGWRRPRVRGALPLPPALHVLRRRRAARGAVGPAAGVADDGRRPRRPAHRIVGHDRDRPRRDDRTLRHGAAAGASASRCPASRSSSPRPATSSEIRSAGPNVTPGYHRDPEATAAAFDDEGFYARATRRASSTRATRGRV